MKKIFLFAAAVVAAMTVNAASFTGFDGRGGDLGAQIASGLLADENNVTLVETSTGKYSIQDANAKKDIYKTYNTYIQPNGARRSVTIPTVAGEKVLIGVQDAVTCAVEGASEGASISFNGWGTDKDVLNTLTATGTEIVLWSDDRAETPTAAKFKLGVILPATAQGVENVDAAAKAIKSFENGQLVIIKNGVKYNALGAKF